VTAQSDVANDVWVVSLRSLRMRLAETHHDRTAGCVGRMAMDGIHGKGMRRAEVGCVSALPVNRPLWTRRGTLWAPESGRFGVPSLHRNPLGVAFRKALPRAQA